MFFNACGIASPTLASFASTFWELSHALDTESQRSTEVTRSCALRTARSFVQAPQALAQAVYCTGRRPDAAGGAAPLPSARVVVVGGFLWGSPRADVTFWIDVPPPLCRRPQPSHHVPLAHPTVGGDVRRGGLVHGPSRPRSVSVMGWVTAQALPRSRRTRRPAASCRAGPTKGGWVGLENGEQGEEQEITLVVAGEIL